MSDVLPRLAGALENRYHVQRQIGIGGMATVYLAHDLRHERDVAIKVLHPDLAAALGAERFLAEIKTTAKLQHPHILPLLDSGDADGLLFYVMPYIAGESLRARLERETQLPVDDAVRIAREVASALESAHRQGVIHRDIKPENILLHEEQALVADFGIALAVSAAGGPRMTQTGLSLGTPAYMAPEQAMGERAIDARADIYALGAVLYEMLVGEAPFTGPSVQAIVARVMTEQPRPVTGQRRSVPAHVNAAVMKALEKIPADRFHSAAELSKALVTPEFTGPGSNETSRFEATPIRSRSASAFLHRPAIAWAVAGLATLAAVVLGVSASMRDSNAPATHLSADLGPGMELSADEADAVGISDDGSMIAVGVVANGAGVLALRSLSDDRLRLVPGSTGVSGAAEFSPDGRWVAFSADEKLLKAPVADGPPIAIGSSRWAQIAWVGNETLIYTKNYDTGLSRISAEGRDSATLTTPDRKKGELGHWWPEALPGGKHILFTNYTTPADKSNIEVISLADGKRRVVLEGGYFGRYVAGHLLFVRGGAVMAVRFDAGKQRVMGSPSPLPLSIETNATNGWAGFAVSPEGTFVYRTDAGSQIQLFWSDEDGREEGAIEPAGRYTEAAPSPDGRSIAVVRDGDVWIFDRQRKIFSRLTRTEQREGGLTWTPDSREVIYQRDVPQFDIFKRAADGSRPEELVVTSPTDKEPESVSPDGRTLLYADDIGGNDLFVVSTNPAGRRSPQRIVGGAGNQSDGSFSPDGSWIVYSSNESGRYEVYMSPYPVDRGPSRRQLSVEGGAGPEWGPGGRTVYFESVGRIHRIRVNPGTGEIGSPEMLARIKGVEGWSIAPDGRLLIGKVASGEGRRSVKVILNWPAMLERK